MMLPVRIPWLLVQEVMRPVTDMASALSPHGHRDIVAVLLPAASAPCASCVTWVEGLPFLCSLSGCSGIGSSTCANKQRCELFL